MREYLLDVLPRARYRRFLVFVMGPYEAHEVSDEAAFDFVAGVRDDLRAAGFNAFLATDADVDLDEMDAGTQSLSFARVSNAVVFVVTHDGKNLGVGIEVGAVLEALRDRAPERVLFLHESGMQSAMIGAVGARWDVSVRTFDDRDAAVDEARLFLADVMNREATGELPFPPD